MVIKYTISPSAMAEDWVLKIWEAQSDGPGAEVYTRNIPAPHNAPYVFSQTGFDTVPHIVRLYAVPSGNLLHDYTEEPTTEGIAIFDPIRFKIGDGQPLTPAADSIEYQNPLLVGLGDEDYEVNRNTYGILFPNLHYTTNPVNGSFQLMIPGDWFNDKEEFVIKRKNSFTTTVVNDSVVAKWFGGFVDIPANLAYDNSHLRKLMRFTGNASYTFGAMDTVPIGYAFCFQNFGNNTVGVVNFLNGGLKQGIGFVNTLTLPNMTEACFVWDGVFWNIVYVSDSRFLSANAIQPGQVLGRGSKYCGDVGAGLQAWQVSHNLGIVGDYTIQVTMRGTFGTRSADTVVIFSVCHAPTALEKQNAFYIATREVVGGNQVNAITFDWIIYKA